VFINQPSYTARYVEDRKTELQMRVVVGKPSNQTSFFYDEIETVEYNPYWGIPRSILVNEYLPKLRANPAYLDERGYEVTDRKGRRISSASVNWNAVGAKPPFDVRQLPGARNALGELKILFPNKHAIYMHDTPSRNLFERSTRAFSHGCVRLHKPREMAAAVLGTNVEYIGSRITGGAHASEDVPGNIPVYVAYFTAWPTDDGKVEYFADMYGRDGRLKKAVDATNSVRAATS
ncbi:MAG: L,D-transpeptidase family protein, partial [Rhizobiaceae bacterium]